MSRLSVTITAPIVLISVLAIGLTVFLNVGKLDRTLGELEESRLRYTVNALRQNLETGLDLGLPVRSLGNAQAAIDFEASQDPDIVSIVVSDEAGQPVFHTSRPAADGSRQDADRNSIKVGATLSNNLGANVGAIELRYSRRGHDEFIAGISAHLLLAALVATAVSILITVLVTRQWARRIGRTLGSIAHALDDSAPAVGKPDRDAAALAEAVNLSAGKAMAELEQARRAVESGP